VRHLCVQCSLGLLHPSAPSNAVHIHSVIPPGLQFHMQFHMGRYMPKCCKVKCSMQHKCSLRQESSPSGSCLRACMTWTKHPHQQQHHTLGEKKLTAIAADATHSSTAVVRGLGPGNLPTIPPRASSRCRLSPTRRAISDMHCNTACRKATKAASCAMGPGRIGDKSCTDKWKARSYLLA